MFGEVLPEKLIEMKLKELHELGEEVGVENASKYKKENREQLIMEILCKDGEKRGVLVGYGELDILPDGYGFLRKSNVQYDIYVSASQIKKFSLRLGDLIISEVREPVGDEKNYAVLKIMLINGQTLEQARERPKFDELIPYYPTDKIKVEVEADRENISGRIIDLIAPIGKGQRGLIVAPPKAGKTVLIVQLANSIIANHPEVILWILLVDERPEEVTDIKENVKDAQVFASTFDEDPHNHVKVTEMVLEKAKRLVEEGKDVVILMDSITRLARAYNIIVPASGKLLSGGIDPAALYIPKKFFGAARNIKKGGSLTILATALVDTGSKMDDLIYEEFKGTGNMEIHLDRELSELRIYPAIDIKRSGTRKEELLLDPARLAVIWKMRRVLFTKDSKDSSLDILREGGNRGEALKAEAAKRLIDLIGKTKSNEELLNLFVRGEI